MRIQVYVVRITISFLLHRILPSFLNLNKPNANKQPHYATIIIIIITMIIQCCDNHSSLHHPSNISNNSIKRTAIATTTTTDRSNDQRSMIAFSSRTINPEANTSFFAGYRCTYRNNNKLQLPNNNNNNKTRSEYFIFRRLSLHLPRNNNELQLQLPNNYL